MDSLGDRAHWLAVRAMTFNSFLVEAVLTGSTVVSTLDQCHARMGDRPAYRSWTRIHF